MKEFLYLFRKLRRRVPALLLMTAAHAGSALLGVAFALGTKGVIDAAVSGTANDLVRACLLQIGIVVAMLSSETVYRYLHNELAALLDRDWKQQIFHTMLEADYAELSKFHSGELLNRLNSDVRQVNEGLLSSLPGYASIATKLVAVITVLTVMEPWFMAVIAVAGVVVVVLTALMQKVLRRMSKAVSAANGRVSGFLQEALEKLMLVQAMDVSAEVENRSNVLMEQRYLIQRKRRRLSVLSNTLVSVLTHGSTFVALAWCALNVYRGAMTFGDLTAITQLVSQLQGPFIYASGFYPKYVAMMASCERLMEIEEICGNSETVESLNGHELYEKLSAIMAEDLTFGYDRDEVLAKSDFQIPKGAFAVITGPSGIGKSTIFKLLLGIFRPTGGKLQVETDGERVDISRATRKLFAYVPQGNLLFSGTLRENLLLTRPDATEEQIEEAIYCSCMDAYLPQLPDGLETMLGENAHGLSEGQAQRLAIARAVLGGAPILLLDEVTSALDAETEQLVLQRLQELPNRTCIAVTHRPAALELANWQLQVSAEGVKSGPMGEN